MNRHLGMLLLAVLALSFAPASAHAEDGTTLDYGRFVVYERGVAVAREEFEYLQFADSMVIYAKTERKVKRDDGTELTFAKSMGLMADLMDFNLRRYVSSQSAGPDTTRRGILPDDTLMTVYVESAAGGTADRLVRPPGKLYVLDSQLWTLLDVVGRNLYRQTFDQRPVSMVAFGDTPSTIEATAKRVAPDTLRWGGRRVMAQRIDVGDANIRFRLWIGPDGHTLKIEQPENKLVVLREAPKVPPPSRRRR